MSIVAFYIGIYDYNRPTVVPGRHSPEGHSPTRCSCTLWFTLLSVVNLQVHSLPSRGVTTLTKNSTLKSNNGPQIAAADESVTNRL